MRVILFFFIIILDIAFRGTLLQHFAIFSTLPNTTLILIVSYSMLRKEEESCIFGFFAGFIFDLFFSNYFGLFTIVGTTVGYFSSKPFTNLYRESFLPPIVTVLVVSFMYELIFYLINVNVYEYVSFFVYLYSRIVPTVLYSVITTPFIFKIISIINYSLEERDNYKRKVF